MIGYVPPENTYNPVLPYKFYDTDMDSANYRDFLSDNEPPKDELRERKRLRKDKTTHIYKSMYRLGYNIDKPARYDLITMRMFKPTEKPTYFILTSPFQTFNLGLNEEYFHIYYLLISMKKGYISLFEIEHLTTSEANNMKVLYNTQYYIIEMKEWQTVIDIFGDRYCMKHIFIKGYGGYRVSNQDYIDWHYEIKMGDKVIEVGGGITTINQKFHQYCSYTLWRMLNTMKKKEKCQCSITCYNYLKYEKNEKYQKILSELDPDTLLHVNIEVTSLQKIDDLFFDGTLLKKVIRKGNSTARAEDTSIVFYALQWLDGDKVVGEDPNFSLEEEKLAVLETLPIRSHYMDEFRVSPMMKKVLERTKPLEIAQIVCMSSSLMEYGEDVYEVKKVYGKLQIPLKFNIKMFNFTEGKTAYNLSIEEKLFHSERKRKIGIQLLSTNQLKYARKYFEEINTYFEYGIENEEDRAKIKEAHLSSLMNTSLCCSKLSDFQGVITICKKVKALRPSEKCSYRLASAYKEVGEFQKGIDYLDEWGKTGEALSQESKKLKDELKIKHEEYLKKSQKLFARMFSFE